MKRITIITVIIIAGFFGYKENKREVDQLIDNTKYYLEVNLFDPGNYVLNANLPEYKLIKEFDSDIYGKFYLYAGEEATYGLRHILARHTLEYFINFDNKNYTTLFPEHTTGHDIISALDEFLDHCVDVEAYNLHPERNEVYLGLTTINGKKIKCLLVVRKNSNKIVTFYPFVKKREDQMLDSLRKEIRQEVENELERRRQSFYWD